MTDQVRPRIMLVDDEPDLLDVCSEALADLASSIAVARNGLEAISLLEKSSFDLVVSDLRMPGAGGMDLLKAMSTIAPGTDVIVLTGYGTIDSAVECVKLGAVNYLLKPFRVEDLRSAVTKAIEERAMRQHQSTAFGLTRMLALNNAMTSQQDARALIKEFLTQVKAAFSPDGIAFFFNGPKDFGAGSQALIGPYFRENPGVRTWFESLAASLAEKGRPMLLEEHLLREAFGKNGNGGHTPSSAIGVPMNGPEGTRGAVVALRAIGSQPYTLSELNLLTLFSAHASLCFESHRACARLKSVNDEIVFSLVHAVEAKDTYTRGHSERVSRFAAKLAKALGLSQKEIDLVRTAAVLHDIGKIGVPDSILNKPGTLSPTEQPLMRQHPAIARTILGKVESLTDALPIVYHHHERFDGSGYPDRLAGDRIPFLARLVSVVDGFEAMTSDRAYHKAKTIGTASGILANGAGTQWDPDIVGTWLTLVENHGPL
ncbi:MAG: response regulator [Desulfovibrio sp.]|jgi:response regulator RpfG family c-di-GMP phosphodiesterase|nr:response regulator [Desulfovibrio sp.]MBI4957973.1 response regulator [Desulfovibrio sp.]